MEQAPPISKKNREKFSTPQTRMSYESEKRRERRAHRSKSDFVYVNHAFEGSTNNINNMRYNEPPAVVIKEQYWACSKWPFMQRILVVTVAILMGAVIGLSVWLALTKQEDPPISGIFRNP